MNLQTDTYYRGYRLSTLPDGVTYVWWGDEFIEAALTQNFAKKNIDDWLEAN